MNNLPRKFIASLVVAVSSIVLFSSSAMGHHSFRALYDYDSSQTILGHVSQIDFINPHIFFNVDVEENGAIVTYRVETMQANLARSYDFHEDSMAVGDPVEVTAWNAHDGSTDMGGKELVLRDGTVFLLRTEGASPGSPNNRHMFGFIGETRSPSPEERLN